MRRRRRRFDDDVEFDEPTRHRAARASEPAPAELDGRDGAEPVDAPPEGDRWSTWPETTAGQRGPRPYPSWLVTDAAAVDRELGVLRTGKEADVHLIERGIPGTDGVLLAAKRYRGSEHRMFHRDAGYLEGRRVRRSREMRAMANRTRFGRDVLSAQWAGAEFGALSRLYAAGVAVPYPVQCSGTELLMEFLGEPDGTAAPRLDRLRPGPDELCDLWHQLGTALAGLAEHGLAHGDLSAYNLLVHRGRLVLIDLPQVVDVIGNPQGPDYLARDVRRAGEWFLARGLPDDGDGPGAMLAGLRERAGLAP